jgi:Uma2 family endonuclease
MSIIQQESSVFIDAYDREETIDGKRIANPRPTGKHVLAVSALETLLADPLQFRKRSPGGWWILAEPQILISRNKLIPDLAGWRRERMPKIPDGYLFETEPDWVCEVISDSSRKIDRQIKPPIYLSGGVKHYWLVEPELRTLEVLRATDAGWLWVKNYSGRDMVRAEPFDEVEPDLLFLWGEERDEEHFDELNVPPTEEK